MISPRGSMYRINRRGPSTEPWGTPWLTGMVWDIQLLMDMNWDLLVR